LFAEPTLPALNLFIIRYRFLNREFIHLSYNGSFESVMITNTKSPCWWHVWCVETCWGVYNAWRVLL